MEKQDHLWPNGPVFTFSEKAFPPSTDSFLLGSFPRLRKNDRVCDLGAGMGLLGLLLWAREPSVKLTAVELQPDACDLCRRNYLDNGIDGTVLQVDLRDRTGLPKAGSCDLVICNPPYFTPNSGFTAEGTRGQARSELTADLDDICAAAAWLLPTGGRFALVYRAERLPELLETAKRYLLEPKRLQLVQNDLTNMPRMFLLECKKGANPGLQVEPVFLENIRGMETQAMRDAYFTDRIDERKSQSFLGRII